MINLRDKFREAGGSQESSVRHLPGAEGNSIAAMTLDVEGLNRSKENLAVVVLPIGNSVGDPVMRLFGETMAGALLAIGDGYISTEDQERREFLNSIGRVVVLASPGFSRYGVSAPQAWGAASEAADLKTSLGLDSAEYKAVSRGYLWPIGAAYGRSILEGFPEAKKLLLGGKCGGGEIAAEMAKYLTETDNVDAEIEAVNVIEPLNPAWHHRFGIIGTAAALFGEFRNIPEAVMATNDKELITAYGYHPEYGQTISNAAKGVARYAGGLLSAGRTNLALARGLPKYSLASVGHGSFDASVVVASGSLVSSNVSAAHRVDRGDSYAYFEGPNVNAIAHLLGAASYSLAA